jgi:hypothetical protein
VLPTIFVASHLKIQLQSLEGIMAFCGKCGAQLHEGATFCANCGASTGASGATGAIAATGVAPALSHPPVAGGVPPQRGFWGSLFDLSFTSFVTIRLIKVLFVLAIIGAAFGAIAVIVYANNPLSPVPGWVGIILAPIVFFLYILIARVYMEIIMVTFRMVEYLRELVEQGRTRG